MTRFYSLLILLWWLSATAGRAQTLNGYTFQAAAGTYAPLSTGAQPLPALQTDDALATRVPLGFSFVLGSYYYTDVSISSNGWLSFDAHGVPTSSSPESGSLYFRRVGDAFLAPLWADLSGAGGTARYATTGTAPNRVFAMEWLNWRWGKGAPQAVVSFQVRLYEGANRIEYSYRSEAGSVDNTQPYSAAYVGVSLYDYALRNDRTLMVSDLSAAPALNPSGSYTGILTKPASGQLFRFTPTPNTQPSCVGPQSVSLDRLGRTTAKVTWIRSQQGAGGTARVYYGPPGFVPGNAAAQVVAGVPGDSATLTGLLPDTDYEYLVEMDCGSSVTPALSTRRSFRTYTPAANDEGRSAVWVQVSKTTRESNLTGGNCQDASVSLPASTTCGGPADARDVWYAFRATETTHEIQVKAGSGHTNAFVVELRDNYEPGRGSLACAVSPAPLRYTNLNIGQTYFIRVYQLTPGFTWFSLVVLGGAPPVPANDNCANAQPLVVDPAPGSAGTAGTVRGATASGVGQSGLGACALGGGGPSKDVWYQFVAPVGGVAEVQLRPRFQAAVEVLSNCTTGPVNYQLCVVVPANSLGRLPLTGLTPGTTYLLRVYNQWETVQLEDATFIVAVSRLAAPPANDDCAGSVPLTVTPPLAPGTPGTLDGATTLTGPPRPTSPCYAAPTSLPNPAPNGGSDVWYSFVATATRHALHLSTTRDAVMEVLDSPNGPPCATGATPQRLACALARAIDPVFSGQPNPSSLPGRLLLSGLTVGRTYWVRVLTVAWPTATKPDGEATFEIALNDWPAPANDEAAGALPLTMSQSAGECTSPTAFTLDGATVSIPPSGTNAPQRDVWFSFVAPAAPAGRTSSGMVLYLRGDQVLQGGMELRESPTQSSAGATSWTGGIRVTSPRIGSNFLVPGRTYYVRIFSTLPDPEPGLRFTLCLRSVITNDEPCGALPLALDASGQCTAPVAGTTTGASSSTTTPGVRMPVSNCGYTGAVDVWYRVVPTSTAFTLRCEDVTVASARLYRPVTAGGTCSGPLQLVSCQNTIVENLAPRALGTVLFDALTPGQPYYLAVANGSSGQNVIGDFTLCVQSATALPARAAAARSRVELWPNPVPAGHLLTVKLPAGTDAAKTRVEWLSPVGQRVAAQAGSLRAARSGEWQLPTAGRAAGLYLLRIWLPNGEPLPAQRVIIQ
ncbi:fibronectin type III domain-containing protein [Hymenobacter sp. CRA2]|uniref:fibronectin type III domain-containing protein n=1 Tax=Hymenobacter sp. CRA2 TaxID=1955620 RepID=UPI00098FAB42|nr:fibronectin type III domain-containing protein [Hymenobacter sp. CRA2]OON69739.1 hypothetical protein B0919_07370 [Hymenobacter sp. CRA2]